MSWDSDEKDFLETFKDFEKVKEQAIKDKRIENSTQSNILFKSKGTQVSIPKIQEKKHRMKYKYYETIDLSICEYPFYFSRIRIMLLMDDLLGVDVISIGQYFPNTAVKNVHSIPLQYIIGDNDEERLKKSKKQIINVLKRGKDYLQLTSKKIFDGPNDFKICRLYLLDYKLDETIETCDYIREELKKNGNENIKLRGKNSNYIEKSLNDESNEHTYISIYSKKVQEDRNICTDILMKARKIPKSTIIQGD